MGIESDGLPKQTVRKFCDGDILPPRMRLADLMLRPVTPEQAPKCATPGCVRKPCYIRGGGERSDLCRPCRNKMLREKRPVSDAYIEKAKEKRLAGQCCEDGCTEPRAAAAWGGRVYPRCKKHQAEWKKGVNRIKQERIRG